MESTHCRTTERKSQSPVHIRFLYFWFIHFLMDEPYTLSVSSIIIIRQLSLSLVISTRYLFKYIYIYFFQVQITKTTAKKTTVESQEANSSLLCLQVELYTKGNGLYAATHHFFACKQNSTLRVMVYMLPLITSLLANPMEPQFLYCYSPTNPNSIFCHSPTKPNSIFCQIRILIKK